MQDELLKNLRIDRAFINTLQQNQQARASLIKSKVSQKTHGNCAQVELQFKPKLASSTVQLAQDSCQRVRVLSQIFL